MHLLRSIEFRDAWFLLAVLLGLPAWFWARRGGGRLRFSSLALVPAHRGSLRRRLAWLPGALLGLGAASLGIALAGPRVGATSAGVVRLRLEAGLGAGK